MFPVLIAVLAALIGGVVLVTSWDEVLDWLQKLVTVTKQMWEKIRSMVPRKARIYGDLIIKGADLICRIMYKFRCKKGNSWITKTETREISENEVPAEIRRKLREGRETDITHEMERELQLTV